MERELRQIHMATNTVTPLVTWVRDTATGSIETTWHNPAFREYILGAKPRAWDFELDRAVTVDSSELLFRYCHVLYDNASLLEIEDSPSEPEKRKRPRRRPPKRPESTS
jgi:hypothetical protein